MNADLQQTVLDLLKKKPDCSFSTEYKKTYPDADDYREIILPKVPLEVDKMYQTKEYSQVFDTRHGFIPNLSIVDLLFNQGPRTTEFI